MGAVFLQFQLLDRDNMIEVERTVEMGKQLAAARGLPAQALAEPVGIDGEKHEIRLPHEIFGERAGNLVAGGEMDEAVAGVVGRALETPARPRLFERGRRANLVNRIAHGAGDTSAGVVRATSSLKSRGA
jgi:hypothetical protein